MDPKDLIRVLIAEDDEGIREIARQRRALRAGVRARRRGRGCRRGDQHWRRASSPTSPLVDVRMPGGGASATRGIKRVLAATRACSPSRRTTTRSRCREMHDAGADGYVVKGSPVSAIVASIRVPARCAARPPRARGVEAQAWSRRGARARPARRAALLLELGEQPLERRASASRPRGVLDRRMQTATTSRRAEIGGAALERVHVERHRVGVAGRDGRRAASRRRRGVSRAKDACSRCRRSGLRGRGERSAAARRSPDRGRRRTTPAGPAPTRSRAPARSESAKGFASSSSMPASTQRCRSRCADSPMMATWAPAGSALADRRRRVVAVHHGQVAVHDDRVVGASGGRRHRGRTVARRDRPL